MNVGDLGQLGKTTNNELASSPNSHVIAPLNNNNNNNNTKAS